MFLKINRLSISQFDYFFLSVFKSSLLFYFIFFVHFQESKQEVIKVVFLYKND